MYSQHEEEHWICEHLKETVGRFLDIGAYDGKTFSNTLHLVELGWSGVCVEPSTKPFAALKILHASNKVEFENVAVTPSFSGRLKFWESDDAVSSSVASHVELWKSATVFRETEVAAISMPDLLAKHPGPYEMVNIDTEGTAVDLALVLPWRDLGTKVLCIEHNGRMAELRKAYPGFAEIYHSNENVVLARFA